MKRLIFFMLVLCTVSACCTEQGTLRDDFKNPPNEYRPMPLWHLNGNLTKDGIVKQITQAKELSGYGGMTVLPVTEGPHWHDAHLCPGMTPEYLGDEYFERYSDMLQTSKQIGTEVILYDDVDFPSGSAGGRLLREYPQYTRKYLIKDEFTSKGDRSVVKEYALKPTQAMTAISAMNTVTLEVVDLQPFMKDRQLRWDAPSGEWKVMAFLLEYNVGPPHGHLVDFMEPQAVSKLMEMTYDQYDKRFADYYGSVINKTFFDDVGFVFMEQTWNQGITDMFRAKTGKNPALFYPALFYDIGKDTRAARAAFYDARSELMAEGYVKQVSEWAGKRNLSSMGHPPESYSPNTMVTSGDLLKFYRHVQIPLFDVIFAYDRGLNGYKQTCSAADLGDKGLVGAELNGAFEENMDSLTLYRVAMDAMVRGVNFIVPHGLWYDTDPDNIRIPPLISFDNPYWGSAVKHYSDFTSRSCVMLQNGRRVVDVAMLWPINTIQTESWMYRDAQSGIPVATWMPDSVNNYRLSGLLTNDLRQDFTYVHPEDFVTGKVTANGAELVLNNKVNRQNYKVLIMPGGDAISAATLNAIKEYYDNGGKVIATASLPRYSVEFGADQQVQNIVKELFGAVPTEKVLAKNEKGGVFAFLPIADKQSIRQVMEKMDITPDVAFDESSIVPSKIGHVNYTHKQKDGKEIYYFTNTTDNCLSNVVSLRGKLENIEVWNPHTGNMDEMEDVQYEKRSDGTYITTIKLQIQPVSSLFVVAKQSR